MTLAGWPDRAGWLWSAAVGLPTLALMGLIGISTGLYHPAPGDLADLPMTLLTVLFVPALGEEAIFRGLLVPSRGEPGRVWPALALSTLVYVLWHPLEGLTFLPGARGLFCRPDFLLVTGLLGLACGLTRWRTGSLWPAVALHWAAVVIWKTWLGGPALETLG
ncbi:MAG: CPBP family intramembrane metalloprotease [Caulobacter sp.]|nr:CPBP family intramembrane metalloprotease [Caulobacter sp.]